MSYSVNICSIIFILDFDTLVMAFPFAGAVIMIKKERGITDIDHVPDQMKNIETDLYLALVQRLHPKGH